MEKFRHVQGREIQSLIGNEDKVKDLFEPVDAITQFTLELWFNLVRKYPKH